MKIYTSYFYQIRFFTPNMIPLSTCLYDPAWYHDFTYDQKYQFKDKRGVWNGLRAEVFSPTTCGNLCAGKECDCDPTKCLFLKMYREQLNNLNFFNIIKRIEKISYAVKDYEGFPEEPIAVLIFHEAWYNPCSERTVVREWFKDNGIELEEFIYKKV